MSNLLINLCKGNKVTENDIRRAIDLAREQVDTGMGTLASEYTDWVNKYTPDDIVNQLK